MHFLYSFIKEAVDKQNVDGLNITKSAVCKEGVKLTKSGFFGSGEMKKIKNESYKTMSIK